MNDPAILTFLVFIIWQLAEAWNRAPADVYRILARTNVIDGYLIPCYDTLHTLGTRYLVEDVSELVCERGGETIMGRHDIETLLNHELENDIIRHLALRLNVTLEEAMKIYYSSKLAAQLEAGAFGIENLDAKYLAEDLIENEAPLSRNAVSA